MARHRAAADLPVCATDVAVVAGMIDLAVSLAVAAKASSVDSLESIAQEEQAPLRNDAVDGGEGT